MLRYTSRVLFILWCILSFVATATVVGKYDGGLAAWQTGILMGIAFIMMSFAVSSMFEVLQDEIDAYLAWKQNRKEQ